jgi:glycopeptide antibiotics resistance protein
MSNPFGEVPALPVVIPLAIVLFGALLLRLGRHRAFSIPRASVAAALSIYAAGIVANTVFPIFLDAPRSDEPWQPAIALIPIHDYQVQDALMNIAVFVPLGILVALLLARPSWQRVVTISAIVSLAIELAQLAAQRQFAGGHVADINDFIFNIVGGAVGYGLLALLVRITRRTGAVDRFRWAGTAATEAAHPMHAS